MITRPCREPGCPAIATSRGYCDEHAKPAERERRRLHDAKRPSAAMRGYGRRWQRIRRVVLSERPLCAACERHGRVTEAREVHHEDGNSRNNARENLTPLCKSCHSKITIAQGRGGSKVEND